MAKLIYRALTCLCCVLLATVIVYFAWLGGWQDATQGRMHRKAFELFSNTNGITKVEIYLLMGEDEDKQKESFPLRPYGREHPTYGTITLTGGQLEEFLEIWNWQKPSYREQASCHSPPYGFRLYRGTALVGETSICWHCSNFYVIVTPGVSVWYSF